MIQTNLSKKCTNCLEENPTVELVLRNENYYACAKCSVTYAKNRKGIAFLLDEEVYLNKYHSKTDGKVFMIRGIFIHEECESGRLIHLVEKETGRPLKALLDVNWLLKI